MRDERLEMREDINKKKEGTMTEEVKSFEARMEPYYREAFAILCERQRRYGPKNILEAGTWGVLEQLTNKVERAKAQINGEVVGGRILIDELGTEREAVLRDSILDLVNYSVILLALRDGEWTKDMRMEVR
jgi:hypothetical protein